MAFPPNYSQERSNRARSKSRKALEKQQKRDDKSDRRKTDRVVTADNPEPKAPAKDTE